MNLNGFTSLVGRVGFEPTITGARDRYYLEPVLPTSSLRPSSPHVRVVWTTAPSDEGLMLVKIKHSWRAVD